MSRFLCNELDGALARVLRSNTLATMAGQTAGAAIPAPRPAEANWQPIKIATKGA